MEPISLSECAYVRPGTKDSFSVQYRLGILSLNLLKASLSVFRVVLTASAS